MQRYAGYTLDDLRGNLYHMSRDQYGCRYIQKLLEREDERRDLLDLVFAELGPCFDELMMGNHTSKSSSEPINFFVRSIRKLSVPEGGERIFGRSKDPIDSVRRKQTIIDIQKYPWNAFGSETRGESFATCTDGINKPGVA